MLPDAPATVCYHSRKSGETEMRGAFSCRSIACRRQRADHDSRTTTRLASRCQSPQTRESWPALCRSLATLR